MKALCPYHRQWLTDHLVTTKRLYLNSRDLAEQYIEKHMYSKSVIALNTAYDTASILLEGCKWFDSDALPNFTDTSMQLSFAYLNTEEFSASSLTLDLATQKLNALYQQRGIYANKAIQQSIDAISSARFRLLDSEQTSPEWQ